uniref:Uncharacterized protein n=1 Tax=Romanomermis culicivorax TaxID=13658 RepID=A0A915JME7_ROMCU
MSIRLAKFGEIGPLCHDAAESTLLDPEPSPDEPGLLGEARNNDIHGLICQITAIDLDFWCMAGPLFFSYGKYCSQSIL